MQYVKYQLGPGFFKGDPVNIDENKVLNEQLECLPFATDLEFPEEKLSIGNIKSQFTWI